MNRAIFILLEWNISLSISFFYSFLPLLSSLLLPLPSSSLFVLFLARCRSTLSLSRCSSCALSTPSDDRDDELLLSSLSSLLLEELELSLSLELLEDEEEEEEEEEESLRFRLRFLASFDGTGGALFGTRAALAGSLLLSTVLLSICVRESLCAYLRSPVHSYVQCPMTRHFWQRYVAAEGLGFEEAAKGISNDELSYTDYYKN